MGNDRLALNMSSLSVICQEAMVRVVLRNKAGPTASRCNPRANPSHCIMKSSLSSEMALLSTSGFSAAVCKA